MKISDILEAARKITLKLLKYGAIFLLVYFIIFGVMASLGGKSDTYKKGVEDFLGGLFSGYAQIDNFGGISFFPSIEIEAEGIEIEGRARENIAAIGKISLKVGFWDIVFSNDMFQKLYVEALRALPGVLLDEMVFIDRMGIFEAGPDVFFKTEGRIGDDALFIEIDMERAGAAYRPKFAFAKDMDFILQKGAATISGRLVQLKNGESEFDAFSIKAAGEEVLSGRVLIRPHLFSPPGIEGTFALPSGSTLNLDGVLSSQADEEGRENVTLSGSVNITDYNAGDWGLDGKLRSAVRAFVGPLILTAYSGFMLDLEVNGADEPMVMKDFYTMDRLAGIEAAP